MRSAATALVATAVVLPFALGADAAPITPTQERTAGAGLTQFGPIAAHGFPAWYRDSTGMRLEACTTLDDPLCGTLPDEVPNPDLPVSYPENFPGEFFYQLAGAELTLSNGADMRIGMDLEGAWATETVVEGDQMVFGRIRIRAKTMPDGRYRVLHPYGADVFEVEGDGINYTQDIGTAPGVFGGALSSRVGPFLKWDTFGQSPANGGPPVGYVGDPAIDHKVTGSPYNTNYVRVERIDADGAVLEELGTTDLFSVQGRLATNAGLDINKATYTVGADDQGVVDVYASSETGQSLQATDVGLGYYQTTLRETNGAYFARLPIDRSPEGRSVTVVNASDNPVPAKSMKLVDVVTIADAQYDVTSHTLTVSATSSDQDSSPASLSVLGVPLEDGTASITLDAPPSAVTVTSDKGGSSTENLVVTGDFMTSPAPMGAAIAPPTAAPLQKVTLTGTGSIGTITSYQWTQVPAMVPGPDVQTGLDENGDPMFGPGPAVTVPVTSDNEVVLVNANSAVATFTAPATPGPIAFQLVVTGPTGSSDPVTVMIDIAAPAGPEGPEGPVVGLAANAGADQTVRRGGAVTLDGSGSTLVDDYLWTQEAADTTRVALNGANTAKPTFTFPAMPLPVQGPAGNPGYTTSNTPLTFNLTVTGQGGQSASDQVVVSPAAETLTITSAEFRSGREWRVSGTSTLLAGQRVAVMLGSNLQGVVLGYATVDAAGAFSFRGNGSIVAPAGVTTVSAVSAGGDDHQGFTFRRR